MFQHPASTSREVSSPTAELTPPRRSPCPLNAFSRGGESQRPGIQPTPRVTPDTQHRPASASASALSSARRLDTRLHRPALRLASQAPQRQGWLWKKRDVWDGFNRRWFVVTFGQFLSYYSSFDADTPTKV